MNSPANKTTQPRRPRPDMDVDLSKAASKRLNSTPKKTKGIKAPEEMSRDLPTKEEREAPKDSPEEPESDNIKKPESIDDFIALTASKVGVKEEQVKSVTETVFDMVQKHAPKDVVDIIFSKVPGADKYLKNSGGEEENNKEEETPPDTPEKDEEPEKENSPEENTAEEEEQPKTRAASISPPAEDDNHNNEEEEEEDKPKFSCMPACLENLINKATGGKGADVAALTELVTKSGLSPDKVKDIVKQLLEFLKGKVGEDKVNQITDKVPGMQGLTA